MVSFSRLWNNVNIYSIILNCIPSYWLLFLAYRSRMASMPILVVKLVQNCAWLCDLTSILLIKKIRDEETMQCYSSPASLMAHISFAGTKRMAVCARTCTVFILLKVPLRICLRWKDKTVWSCRKLLVVMFVTLAECCTSKHNTYC